MAIQFKVGFVADTKDLESSLSKIQGDISKAFNFKGNLTKELSNATQQAMVLEKALTKATATDGTISYGKLTAELTRAGTSVTKMTTTLAKGGDMFRDSLNQANAALALSNRSAITLGKQMKEIWRVTTQSFKFTAAQTFLRAVSSAAQDAKRWVVDLNEAVNNIAVVTGKTGDEITRVTQQAIRGSKELKVAAKNYAEGALIFYQQGLNDEEVTRRNEITIKASLAANQSIETMSKQLTAIWNTYGMVGEEQERAAAVGAALAAKTAVDFKDIAEAMQSAAAPAAQMGVKYNQLAAIIATVGDVTQQSASTIGNAYKTIFSRFQQLKAEGTDGEVTLSSVSAQLKGLGIEVLDQAGNLRELGDVINEVGNNWDNWSQTQQTAIAQIVGGTRQYGQFLALMQNFDKYQKNLGIAEGESGATLETQYTQALDSIDHKMEQSAEAWRRAFSELIPEKSLKVFYDGMTMIGDIFGTILKGAGGLPGILSVVGVALSNKIVPTLIQAKKEAASFIQNLTPNGRVNGIRGEYKAQDKELGQQIASAGSKGLTEEKRSLEIQREKLKLNQRIAIVNEQINTAMKTASQEEKVKLELEQNRLKYVLEQNQSAVDQARELERQYGLLGQITSELEKQAILERDAVLQQVNMSEAKAASLLQQIAVEEGKANNAALSPEKQDAALQTSIGLRVRYGEVIAELTAQYEALGIAEEKVVKSKSASQIVNDINKINQAIARLNSGGKAGSSNIKLAQQMKELKDQMIQAAGGVDKLSPELQELLKHFDGIENKSRLSKETLNQLNAVLNQLAQETGQVSGRSAELSAEMALNTEDFRKFAQAVKMSEEELKRFIESRNNVGRLDMTQVITSFVQVGAAIGQCILGVRNLIETWKDPDTSGLDKIIATFTQLSMMMYSFNIIATQGGVALKGLAKLGGVVAGGLGGLLTKIGGSAASAGAGLSGMAAAAANGGTALSALIPQIGIAVATIGLLVAAGVAIYNVWKKWYDAQPEQVLKRAKEAAEDAKESFESVKQEVEELFGEFDNYKSAVQKLKECEEGTVDWYNALLNVNAIVDALIDKMPFLKDYIEIGPNGEKTITPEGINQAKQIGNQRLIMGQASVTQSEIDVQKALQGVIESERKNLNQMMSSLTSGILSTYTADEPLFEKYYNLMEQWLKDNPNATGEAFKDALADFITSDVMDYYGEDKSDAQSVQARKNYVMSYLNTGDMESYNGTIDDFLNAERTAVIELGKTEAEIKRLNKNLLTQALQIKGMKLPDNVAKGVQSIFDQTYADINAKWLTTAPEDLIKEYVQKYGLTDGDYTIDGDNIKVGEETVTKEQMAAAVALLEASNSLSLTIDQLVQKRNRVSNRGGMREFAMTQDVGDLSRSRYNSLAGTDTEGRTNLLDASGFTREEAQAMAKDIENDFTLDWDGMIKNLPYVLRQVDTLSYNAAQKFGEMWEIARRDFGTNATEWANSIKGIVDALPKENQTEALNMIANTDWSQADAAKTLISNLNTIGIMVDEDSELWKNFTEQMEDFGNAIPSLSTLISDFKTLKSLLSEGFNVGDAIDVSQFKSLLNLSEELSSSFVRVGDEMVMIGDPLDLLQNATLGFLKQAEGKVQRWGDEVEDVKKRLSSLTTNVGGEDELETAKYNAMYEDKNSPTGFYWDRDTVDDQMEIITKLGLTEQLSESIIKKLNDNHTRIEQGQTLSLEETQEIADLTRQGLEEQEALLTSLENEVTQAQIMLAFAASSAEERKNLLRGDPDDSDGNGLTEASIDAGAYGLAAQQAMMNEKWEGLDPREVEEYSKALMDAAEKSDLLADSLKNDAEAAEDVALYTKKMNKGIDKLADGFKDWNSVIKKSDASSEEYAEAMVGMKDAMSDVLGVSEEFLSNDFIVDNLEDIEKAANGDADAIDRLAIAASKDIVHNIVIDNQLDEGMAADIESRWATLAEGLSDIEVGMKLDLQGMQMGEETMLEYCNQLIRDANMTTEQANAAFRAIGFEPTFVETEEHLPLEGTTTYTTNVVPKTIPVGTDGKNTFTYIESSDTYTVPKKMEGDQVVKIPALSGGDKVPEVTHLTRTNKGNMNNYSKNNGGGKKPGSGNSGGGKQYKNDAKKKEVEKPEQRYENINSQIEAVTKNLDKLSKAEEDAWGAQKTRNLRAINRELAIQNKLLERKVKEAKDYYDGDLSNLTSSSILNGAGFNVGNILVNQDGTIANPEQIKDALWETYVKPFVDAENDLIGSTNEEAVKAAQQATEDNQKLYEKGLELLEKVNDSAETYHETLQQIVDNIHEMMDNMMTELESRLDFRIRVNDRDIRRIEKLMDRWGELGIMNGETYDLLTKKIESIQEKISATVAEIDNAWGILGTVENAKAGDKEAFNKIADYFNLTEENGGLAALNQWIEGNAGMPEQIMEFLIENRDNLEEMYSEIVDSTLEQLDGLFQKANKWLEDTLGKWQNTMDLNSSIIDFFDSVAEFNGAYMSNDLDNQTAARTIMTAQMSRQQADLDSKIANHNMLGNMIEAAEAAKENLKANIQDGKYNGKSIDMYDKDTREYWNNQLKAAQEAKKAAIAAGDAAAETKALTEETEIRMLMEFGAGAADMIDTQIQEWRQQQAELLPEIVNSGAELLQVATENIEKEKELAKKNIGTILGGLFTDLEDLADNYSRVKEQQDIKFDDYDQTYMTNKLQKQYDDWAENADAAGLEQMAQWQEKLNKYKETYIELDENGNEVVKHRLNMTQDEYDLLQKEFELEQLKAQFEDAQNNKNTMRLTRDASGNYSYVYSSDQSQSEDNLQAIADKEYEYKKLLESIQDQTMQAAISVGEEWQNVVDNINWQLWKTDDVYRTTMIKKLQSLMMSLDEYGAKSGRIFDDLAVGVGTFGSVWDESAGEITTGATSIQNFIHDMSKALAGEGDLGEGMDESSYIGRVLGAQKYWANEANTALKDSMEDLASDEKGIPHEFGIITEGVLGAIGKISAHGEGDNGSSGYSQFVGNTEWLRKQINGLLNGPENSVQGAYDALVTGTNTSLNTGNPSVTGYHNKFLENIQDIFGRPGDVNDSTVFGKYGQLKLEMAEAMDKSNEVFMNMTNDMVNWAQQSCKAIGEVIDQIAAYIAAIDQKEDAENRKLQEEAEDYTPWTQPDTPTPDVPQPAGPGITTPADPGPGTGGGGSPSVGDRVRIKTSVTTTPSGKTWKGFVHNGVTTYKVAQVGGRGHDGQVLLYMPNYNGDFSDKGALAASAGYTGWFWASDIEGYATGGLVDSERIIKAGEEGPELVLNAEDTKNILAAVAMMRQTVAGQLGSLNTSLATSTGSLASLAAQTPAPQSPQAVDQQVKIEASFPGVSVAQEIEDALNSLITQAAQYNIKR